MFARRKVNRSGSISVHVVDKSRGGFKVIKTFGTASTAYEADLLEDKARQYIREQTGQLESLIDENRKSFCTRLCKIHSLPKA